MMRWRTLSSAGNCSQRKPSRPDPGIPSYCSGRSAQSLAADRIGHRTRIAVVRGQAGSAIRHAYLHHASSGKQRGLFAVTVYGAGPLLGRATFGGGYEAIAPNSSPHPVKPRHGSDGSAGRPGSPVPRRCDTAGREVAGFRGRLFRSAHRM